MIGVAVVSALAAIVLFVVSFLQADPNVLFPGLGIVVSMSTIAVAAFYSSSRACTDRFFPSRDQQQTVIIER